MAKVVVVTGASAGLGRAIVREFAKQRCRLVLIARNEEALRVAADEVKELGSQALVIPLDVSDGEAVERAADLIEREFGPIDVWVNNAMVSVFSPAIDMEFAEYRRVTDVTYLGYVYGTLAAVRRMRKRNSGVVVQVGSALAYRAIPNQSAYCAAKHAVKGFTQSLRCELLHEKSQVRLSMVQMPALNTPQFSWVKSRHPQPVPPIYQPEIAARAVVWAADKAPRELLVAYPTVKAVIGEKLAPAYADRYLAEHGVDSQMTDEPVEADRPNNLWSPLPGDWGAHGEFDERAWEFSPQLWLNLRKKQLATVLSIAILSAFGLAKWSQLSKRSRDDRAA
jgi:NAD(P)-dependent dehydrogenase (short-subunit alcohol dehydrogenase family)